MGKSWGEITELMLFRRQSDNNLIRRMIEVRDHYNGDMVIPLPDVEGEPFVQQNAPQIIADGIDHTAMRGASVMPAISCPAVGNGPRSHEYAAIRRRALYANWHFNAIELLAYRAFRHFVGYGTASLLVMPDFESQRARIELRDPLTSYPELRSPDDFHAPLNIGYVFGRSADWLKKHYPQSADLVGKGQYWDTLWDVVEWIDQDEIVLGILGPRASEHSLHTNVNTPYNGMELRRWPNKAGMVPAACPRRATLDRIAGQLSHVIPIVNLLNKMNALEIIAAERMVFPDMVIMGRKTAVPQVLGGKWKDGREGEPNYLLDAEGVQLLQSTPGPLTFQTIDRLERAARISGGVLPQFGGETGGSLRTGRALDTLGSFSVDPRVMEAQKFMARAYSTLNEGICAIEKGYWPAKKYTVFSGWAGDTEMVEYQPAKHFETHENVVSYSFPGLDVSQITVAVGQLVGAGLLSKDTARTRHPYVDDAMVEEKRIVTERIDDAILMTFLNQAGAGALPLIDLVRIQELYNQTGSMAQAVKTADREARERQAQQVPEPPPGMAVAPEAEPGLALPGQGAEAAPPPAIGPPQESQVNLANVLQALRAR